MHASTSSGSSEASWPVAVARSHVWISASMNVPATACATGHSKPSGDMHVRSKPPGARSPMCSWSSPA